MIVGPAPVRLYYQQHVTFSLRLRSTIPKELYFVHSSFYYNIGHKTYLQIFGRMKGKDWTSSVKEKKTPHPQTAVEALGQCYGEEGKT